MANTRTVTLTPDDFHTLCHALRNDLLDVLSLATDIVVTTEHGSTRD